MAALSVRPADDDRRLGLEDMEAASTVFRTAFDARLPWLADLHTPDDDVAFWRGHLFSTCEIWGAVRKHEIVGVIVFRKGWVDQLHVLPAWQGQGIGTGLLDIAREGHAELSLWTFRENAAARTSY